MAAFTIRPARTSADLAVAASCFREYAADLPITLDFQGFEAELAALPGKYAPPGGELLLAWSPEGAALGCVALRALDEPGVCEMKRLYVREPARRLGLGAALVEAVLAAAEARGYREMRLDTLASMTPALTLYARFGFRPVPAYCYNPEPDAVFLGRRVGAG